MKKDILPIVPYGTIPKVLLLGNGINQTFDKASWDGLLEKITTVKLSADEEICLKSMPYPLRPVVLSDDKIDKQMDKIAPDMLRSKLNEEQKMLLKEYVGIGFDAILTTNYTYEIEQTIDTSFECQYKARSKYRISTVKESNSKLNLYKCMNVSSDNRSYQVWHVHGEAARPNSMILGHYYYGKALSEIETYVAEFMRRYKGCNSRGLDFKPQSWVDYFLLGNVYIVGFGMDFSEMDLWWLVNCKKRHFSNCGKIYYYEPNLANSNKQGIKMVAEAYGINVITETVNNGEYLPYYKKIINNINKRIGGNK